MDSNDAEVDLPAVEDIENITIKVEPENSFLMETDEHSTFVNKDNSINMCNQGEPNFTFVSVKEECKTDESFEEKELPSTVNCEENNLSDSKSLILRSLLENDNSSNIVEEKSSILDTPAELVFSEWQLQNVEKEKEDNLDIINKNIYFIVYKEDKNSYYDCLQCDGHFKLNELKTHIRALHKLTIKYECEQCHKQITQLCKLKNHIDSIHKKIKKIKYQECHKCKKMFPSLPLLKQHISIVHDKVKYYACNFCSKKFFCSRYLNKHILAFHKGVNFKCEYCNKIFSDSAYMIRHTNAVHKGIKNYECMECNKCFSHKYTLEHHVNTVHENIRNYGCSYCKKAFARPYMLKNHIAAIHKDILNTIVNKQ